jgi:D-glycero-alpha-D-manno-heptose-7-phosphate kinase
MIITRTPFRISFVGGGSELAAFYEKSAGAVLSTTINKYMYISSHKFFEADKIRTEYSKTETVGSVAEIEHPILRTIMQQFDIKGGLEISSIADVPGGTGMGSSSSFTVGTLHNLSAATQTYANKEQLASMACDVEINKLGEPIGKQDQYAAAYGGLNIYEFLPNGAVNVRPVNMASEAYQELQDNLVMFYIGNQRSASKILAEQTKNTSSEDKFTALQSMVNLVYDLEKTLIKGELDDFGRIMHENWILKQKLASGITNPLINEVYDAALANGALGGKLLGAGGGGFMLFYCPKNKQEKLTQALSQVRLFDFDFEQGGSQVIFHSNE